MNRDKLFVPVQRQVFRLGDNLCLSLLTLGSTGELDAPLFPHCPAQLEVAVGGEPALVPKLGSPKAFLGPDGPVPVGPRPSAERAWDGRLAEWRRLLGNGDVDGLWAP